MNRLINIIAHIYWVMRGKPQNSDWEDWFKAEKMIAHLRIITIVVVALLIIWVIAGLRHVVFWSFISFFVILFYYLNKRNKKKTLLAILALIPLSTFIFQYWPIFSFEGVYDVLYGKLHIAPEQILLNHSNFEGTNTEDVIKYFDEKKIKFLLPSYIKYAIRNQSQAVLDDVIVRHILLSVETDKDGLKRMKDLGCGLSQEKFVFAPEQTREFLIEIDKSIACKVKSECGLHHIYLIVTAYCRPMLFPYRVTSLKDGVSYYSDCDRLWSIVRMKDVTHKTKDVFEKLKKYLLKENVTKAEIDEYINSINFKNN